MIKQRFIYIFATILLIAISATNVFAQTEYKPVKIKNKITSNNETRYKPLSMKKDTLGSFSSRLSISTNFIDWALFTPNIGFDFDLGNQNLIGGQSINLNFRYHPEIYNQNYWSGRIEYRWHFRFNEHPAQRRGLTKPILGLYNLLTYEEYKSEAMARAMESSQLQRPEMIGGRHYAGIFAEYFNFNTNSKFDIFDKNKQKEGFAVAAGLTLGYEFPAFYNRNHYWQFHFGGNLGVLISPYDLHTTNTYNEPVVLRQTKVLPMITELKFGLTYRKESISRKYWKQNNRIEIANVAENREMQALIDSITENYSIKTNIFISVPKVDKDNNLTSPIDKKAVIKAIREQTKMPLAAANFVNDTIFPIKKLDDYTITYRFKKAVNKYSDELEEYTDVIFRFRVEMAGRKEAEKLKQTLVDALQKYRNEKGMPVLYAQAKPRSGDRNEIEEYIPWSEVMTLFSRIWGKTITLHQFKGVSQRVGVGVTRPVDEKGINRRSRYTISLSFHPQVELNYDTDPTLSQFEVQFRGESQGLSNYNKINGHRLAFERNYKGGDEFTPEITASDIATALKRDGIDVKVEDIDVASGQNKFGTRYTAAIYLQAGYVANVSYVVNDKGGLEKAKADFNSKVNPWIASRKWPEIVVESAPKNPKDVEISHEQIIKAFNKASGYKFADYQFIDYCVDGDYTQMQDGRYRAYVKIQLHREFTTVPKIPYYIRFDNSKAEAERLAREKAEKERLAKLEAERKAREKFVADSIAAVRAEEARLAKLARDKFVADSLAEVKAEQERLAKIEAERQAKLAREKYVADSIAAAKAEAERLAKLAREKFVADSIAAEKAEQERLAREEAERLAAEQAEAERVAVAKAEAERLAREKAEAERLAAEKAEQERLAAEKAEQERLAAEKAERERLAKEEADRLAREEAAKQEAERVAKEKAAAEKAEQERLAAEKAERERLAKEEADKRASEEARLAEELRKAEEAKALAAAEAAKEAEKAVVTEKELEPEPVKKEESRPKYEAKPGQKVGIIVQKSEVKKPEPKVSVNTQTLEEAREDLETKVKPWIQMKKKAEIIFRGEPVDPKTLNITKDKIITAFRKASGYVFKEYHFVDYCVGGNYVLLPDGRYRGMAKIKMHDELDPIEIPYFVRFAQ